MISQLSTGRRCERRASFVTDMMLSNVGRISMNEPWTARPTDAPRASLSSRLYRLTVEQFERLLTEDVVESGERLELIEGLLVRRPRRDRARLTALNRGLRALWRVMPPGWHVARTMPVVCSEWSRVRGDLLVLRGGLDDPPATSVNAADVALIVTFADACPSIDPNELDRVYANAGAPIHWLVDLAAERIEIASGPSREGYQSRHVVGRGQDVPVTIAGIEAGWIAASEFLA